LEVFKQFLGVVINDELIFARVSNISARRQNSKEEKQKVEAALKLIAREDIPPPLMSL